MKQEVCTAALGGFVSLCAGTVKLCSYGEPGELICVERVIVL